MNKTVIKHPNTLFLKKKDLSYAARNFRFYLLCSFDKGRKPGLYKARNEGKRREIIKMELSERQTEV